MIRETSMEDDLKWKATILITFNFLVSLSLYRHEREEEVKSEKTKLLMKATPFVLI